MNKFLMYLLVLLSTTLYAQEPGKITGRIIDAQNAEAIIGANVLIEGTNLGAATDIEGDFRINAVPAGTYTLVVSYITHNTKKITGVVVVSGQTVVIDVALSEAVIETEEVVVTAKADNSYTAAVLNQQKKAAQVSDGVSGEQIKKSPDATSSDALKRVTGVTIVEGKYVYVRGTSERYSNAMINNTSMSSTEPDRKSFAFDIFPANLLENTIIRKTFTPDLPGDFSGGLVELNTVDFPATQTLRLNIGTSYNSLSTFKDFQTYKGGNLDFLGIDNSRKLPDNFPSEISSQLFKPGEITELAKTLNNTWASSTKTAAPGLSLGLSYGDVSELFGSDLGYIVALTYKNSFSTEKLERNEYEASGDPRFEFTGTQSTYNVLWGGLVNLTYKLSNLHKISFKNTYTNSADDDVFLLDGANYSDAAAYQQQTALRFVSRNVYTGQLTGEHSLSPESKLLLGWRAYYSSSKRNEPDYRRIIYQKAFDAERFSATLGFQPNLKNGGRFYSDLNEDTKGFGTDLSFNLGEVKIKTGLLYDDKQRGFNSRLISVITNAAGNGFTDFSLLYLPLEEIFDSSNFRRNGFSIGEYINGTNNYTAAQRTASAYAMFDSQLDFLSSRLRMIAGVRVESALQEVNSMDLSRQNELQIKLDRTDFFPSLNLIYSLDELSNLRFAFSQTINRPELRELAPFSYYDFQTQTTVSGNPNLDRALINNFDLRYELYPAPGELLSISAFYKQISNAIEKVVVPGVALNAERTFMNSERAVNYGFEIEARKSLGFISEAIDNFFVTGNYTIIKSSVDIKETETTIGRTDRALQGQSPYTLNFSLGYSNFNTGTEVNLLYNTFGKRIMDVATLYEDDIIEQSRDLIDFAITQMFYQNFELKFTIRDLLNQEQVFTQGDNRSRVNQKGTSYSLSFGYRF